MATEPDKSQQKGFKRINFFRGFLTTEHDWNDAEKYHLEKRRLHNRLCHAPGVIYGFGGNLQVVARARGDLSVEVMPGYAIDGSGNDLVLWETQIKNIVPEDYKLPGNVFVVLRYCEELTDFIAYKENLEYKGHRRVQESARVELTQTVPEIGREVELARVYLEKGATRIRDARDPADPKANEIDARYPPKGGVAGTFFDPITRNRIGQVLTSARKNFVHMAREGVVSAHSAAQAFAAAQMMHESDALDLRNIFKVIELLIESEREVAFDVEVNHPTMAGRKEFADYKRHVEILQGILGERRFTAEALNNYCAYQQKAAETAHNSFGSSTGEEPKLEVKAAPAPAAPGERPKAAAPQKLAPVSLNDFDTVKVMSGNMPDEVVLEGRPWVLVDSIDILDKASEDAHEFNIADAKDSYRSRQKLKYPDGTAIEDTGRAHVGGYAQYKVKNVTPGRDLCIVRRMDYVYGDYEIEFFVDGKSVGVGSCAGTDRVNRWRNWPYLISGDKVTGTSVTIKQLAVTAGRDVNMFRFWFFQPK